MGLYGALAPPSPSSITCLPRHAMPLHSLALPLLRLTSAYTSLPLLRLASAYLFPVICNPSFVLSLVTLTVLHDALPPKPRLRGLPSVLIMIPLTSVCAPLLSSS